MRRVVNIFALGLGVLAVALASSCITPSIPIPPPDPARMTFTFTTVEGQGQTTFAYPATDNYIGSVAFIYNRTLHKGIIEDAHDDGSVGPTSPLAASLGDEIIVSLQRDDLSVSTCIKLREGAQDPTDYCGP